MIQTRSSDRLTPSSGGGLISVMYRPKYGDVSAIADKTNECCHLCGEPAPLHTYGRCNIYGGRAASIDHLVPQYFGGDHAPENLMWAHQGCNSYRGVRDFEEVRMELRGDTYMMEDEPVDNGAQVLLGAAGGMALGAALGYMLQGSPQTNEDRQRANGRAFLGAMFGGLLGVLLFNR